MFDSLHNPRTLLRMKKLALLKRIFNRNVFIALLVYLSAGNVLATSRPNIIVIYTDDHGWPDIGAAGIYDDLRTPHIDALAASGVRALNGYSTAPQCVPSRAGLLIGKFQSRFGVESNGDSLDGFNAEQTIAERLKVVGYATGQIGKWHLGANPQITDHGFDDVYAKNANRSCYANFNLAGDTLPMQMIDDKLYHLDACSDAALAFIKRHENESFFLYLAYRAPHVPLDAPLKYLERFPGDMPERRRQCLAMLSSMDDGVGRIRAALKERGLLQNTLIFYIGDNGAPLKIHKLDAPGGGPGWDGSLNEPLNGEKGMLSEGGIRVPFLVSWPGTIPAEQVYEAPLSSLDVAATSVAISGAKADPTLDGTNLIPALTGKATALKRPLYWRWIAQAAVRDGKWKYLRGGTRSYLYDLDADKEEKHNLLAQHPEIGQRLHGQLEAWTRELQPPELSTKPMAETWEKYFDHYLDGKRATQIIAKASSFEGWVIRNAKGRQSDNALIVSPPKGDKKPAFMACASLNVKGPANATISILAKRGGKVGLAWRLKGQSDFVSDQSTYVTLPAQKTFQIATVDIPTDQEIIHLRVLLPSGENRIQHISLKSKQNGGGKEWSF